jgi:apolipoprotein N-acyltransferase
VAATVKSPVAELARAKKFGLPWSILLALISSVLLDFCFPVAGPMPRWRSFIAWFALVPLLFALLNENAAAHPRYLRRSALVGYVCGVCWYVLNCYWIYQTMLYYGHVPAPGAAGIVVLFSAGAGALLWAVWIGAGFFSAALWIESGAGSGAVFVDRAGAGGCADHERAVGSAGVFAGGQSMADPTRADGREFTESPSF